MGRIVDMPLPRLGETMDEGRIGLIIKKPGEKFRRGETLLEVESDKTTVEVPALQDGILVEWLVASDQMVPVESAIARIEIEGEAAAEARVRAPVIEEVSPRRKPGPISGVAAGPGFHRDGGLTSRPRASTAARAAARRTGTDLSAVAGTGRNGRITTADLAAAAVPARATYHVETARGKIFFREWPAQGVQKGIALLIHGLFGDSQSFTTLGRKLAAHGLRTLALDLPGHGETAVTATSLTDVVASAAAALPPGRFHIIGHSYGAIIATHLAQWALSLTLLSPAGCGEAISGEFVDAMLGGHVEHAMGFLGENIPAIALPGLAEQLSANAGQLRAIAATVAEGNRQTVSILGELEHLAMPIRALFLRDDAVIPSHQARDLPPNVAVHFLKGASHLPHWRNPDLIASLVAGG